MALAREGTGWSSEELARRLGGWMLEARPVALVIGGIAGSTPHSLPRRPIAGASVR